jgi:Esterase FrsA-like
VQTKDANSTVQFIFKHPQYSFQLLRAIAAANGEAADIGECLAAAQAIREGNDESWYNEWFQLAKRMELLANSHRKKGHLESARTSFLRASNYYRTAEFFLHINPQDPRLVDTWEKSRESFREAAKLSKNTIKEVRIPFENTTLPGYFCFSSDDESPKPLVIIQTGFDGTAEELYYQMGRAGISRGYNCLLFEGPGQGEMIREQFTPFRSNWESVITPVVDFALKHKQVDKNRLALIGISFGGYLVPRALAFEKRIKLAIANGGVYDFHQVCMREGLAEMEKGLDDPKICKEIDSDILEAMKADVGLRWGFGNGMFTFQAATPSEWLKMTRSYHVKDVVKDIKTKMLIIDSDRDEDMPGQSRLLYEHLQCPKEFMLFTSQEGAGEHCQIGAYAYSNERIFNWLDENI